MTGGDPSQPFRVLFVDDNQDAADSASTLLRLVGFTTLACYSGAAALELNETYRPEICFIDLNMPGMDGDELALRLRSGLGWQPLLLVAMTAMSDDRSRGRTGTAGFDLHLVKPVDPRQLLIVTDDLFEATKTRLGSHPIQKGQHPET